MIKSFYILKQFVKLTINLKNVTHPSPGLFDLHQSLTIKREAKDERNTS